MNEIKEYEDILNFCEEITRKEITPERLKIDRDEESFKEKINILRETGILDPENSQLPLNVRLIAIMKFAKGDGSIAQYVGKTWALGDAGIMRSKKLAQFPCDKMYYNGKFGRFSGRRVDVLGLRMCGWAFGEFQETGEAPYEIRNTLLLYDLATLIGISEAAVEEAEKYSMERVAFDRKIYEFEEIKYFIKKSRSLINGAKQLLLKGNEPEEIIPLTLEAATFSTDKSMQIFGGYGFINEYPAQKFFRDTRTIRSLLIRYVQGYGGES